MNGINKNYNLYFYIFFSFWVTFWGILGFMLLFFQGDSPKGSSILWPVINILGCWAGGYLTTLMRRDYNYISKGAMVPNIKLSVILMIAYYTIPSTLIYILDFMGYSFLNFDLNRMFMYIIAIVFIPLFLHIRYIKNLVNYNKNLSKTSFY